MPVYALPDIYLRQDLLSCATFPGMFSEADVASICCHLTHVRVGFAVVQTSGVTPRRRRPARVRRRGSSQPHTKPSVTSLFSLRLDSTLCVRFSRAYSHTNGLYVSSTCKARKNGCPLLMCTHAEPKPGHNNSSHYTKTYVWPFSG